MLISRPISSKSTSEIFVPWEGMIDQEGHPVDFYGLGPEEGSSGVVRFFGGKDPWLTQ